MLLFTVPFREQKLTAAIRCTVNDAKTVQMDSEDAVAEGQSSCIPAMRSCQITDFL